MNCFEERLAPASTQGLHSDAIENVQVNVGLRCNMSCAHCHVQASPKRKETMEWSTMEQILAALDQISCKLVDITGGAPEMNPHFRRFVKALRERGLAVQARTNLTVMLEPGMEDLPAFYREHRVHLVASLPCYLEKNVRAQRGATAYERSVQVIKKLNALGYGIEPELPLNLVYNPNGPFLPPDQLSLEADYKRELKERFGIQFTRLMTITNTPIGRFHRDLEKQGRADAYMQLLKEAFNQETVDQLMCRHQISVRWDGTLFDCDFNLALSCPVDHGAPNHISSFDPRQLSRRRIVTGEHCFACTAGAGSSCGGALSKNTKAPATAE